MTNEQRSPGDLRPRLCLRPRFGTGQMIANYPWYLRPLDPVRCLCGRATCADVSVNPEPYWLSITTVAA